MNKKSLKTYNDCLFFGTASFLIVVLLQLAANTGNVGVSNLILLILLFSGISTVSFTICLGIRISNKSKIFKPEVLAIVVCIIIIVAYLSKLSIFL